MTMQSTQSDAKQTRNKRELILVLMVLFLLAIVLVLLLTRHKTQKSTLNSPKPMLSYPQLTCPNPTLSCPQLVCPNLSAGNNPPTQLASLPEDAQLKKSRSEIQELKTQLKVHGQGQVKPGFPDKKLLRKKHQRVPNSVIELPQSSKAVGNSLKDEQGNCVAKRLCLDKHGVQIDIPVDWARDAQCNCVPLRTAAQDEHWKQYCSGMDWLGCKNRCTQSNMNRYDCDKLYGPGRFD